MTRRAGSPGDTPGEQVRIRNVVVVTLALAGLWACGAGYGPTSPADVPPAVTAMETVVDPSGDTFLRGTGVQWDVTAFTVARDTGGITVSLDFSSDVISPMSGDSTAIIGDVELDLDQDSVSGGGSVVDAFRHATGSTGLGVDLTIDLTRYAADSSVAVFDSLAVVKGRVRPVFAGHRIAIRIPRALIGNDDGFLNAAAIMGSAKSPTDIVPNNGHLTLSDPTLVAHATLSATAHATLSTTAHATLSTTPRATPRSW